MSLIADRDVSALSKAPQKRKLVFKWILISLAMLIIFLIFLWIISWERQQTRDSVRLADMANLRLAMQAIYLEQGSFDLGEACESNHALLTQTCWEKLQHYVDADALSMDPKGKRLCTVNNCNSTCQYAWGELSKDNFEIIFNLEHPTVGLSAGCHVLDRAGIR